MEATSLEVPEKQPKPAACPYCGVVLEPKPKRGKACPNCGETFRVLEGELVTLEEGKIRDWLRRLESLGVTRRRFDQHREQLSRQFGFTAPVNDTVWRILNSLITPKADHTYLAWVHLEMAHLLSLEGKDARQHSEEARKHLLLGTIEVGGELAGSGIEMKVEVGTRNDNLVCPACRDLEKRTFTLDEAESLLTSTCQNADGCRCSYSLTVE